jgi:hypothetical protein
MCQDRSREVTVTEPKPPKKRVVSKSEYAAHLAKRTTLKAGSSVMLMSSAAFFVIAFNYVLEACLIKNFVPMLGVALVSALAGCLLIWGGKATQKRAEKIELLFPLAYQHLEQHAEETLLRASTEPIEEIEKVLLRAATGAAETPPEQLLRPDVSPSP